MSPTVSISRELILSHAGSLRRLARSLLADPHAAEDVLQETWLVAMQRPPGRLDGHESLGGWLRAVVRSLALKRRRGESRRDRRERAAARPESLSAADEVVERADTLRRLVEAVVELEEPYRTALFLRFFEELAPREIALRLGVPVATVRSRVQRGLARLRERLDTGSDWRQALGGLLGLGLAPSAVERGAGGMATGGWIVGMQGKLSLAAAAVALAVFGLWQATGDPGGETVAVAGGAGGLSPRPDVQLQGPVARPGAPGPIREELARPESEDRAGRHGRPRAETLRSFAVEGVVVDEWDRPVAGAELFLGPPLHVLNRAGRTDGLGRFRIEWRAKAAHLTLALCARGPGGGGSGLRRIDVAADAPHALRLALEHDGGTAPVANLPIVGRFFEEGAEVVEWNVPAALIVSRSALDGAPELAGDPASRLRFRARSAPASQVFLDLGVSFWSAELAAVQLQHEWILTATELIESIDEVEEFEEGPGSTVTVEGTVTTAAGEPAAGALVGTPGSEGAGAAWTTADEAGAFRLEDLEPGELSLRAGGGDLGLARAALATGPGQSLRWDPWLDRGLEVAGWLVGPGGEPLEGYGVRIESTRAERPWSDRTRADEDGFFAIPNAPELPYRLTVFPPRGLAQLPLLERGPVWPGRTPGELQLVEAQLPGGALQLTPEDAGGEPCPDVEARLWTADGRRGAWFEWSEEERAFTARGLASGRYRVELGSSERGWLELGPVFVGVGEAVDLGRVTFAPPGRAVAVLDLAAAPEAAGWSWTLVHRRADVDSLFETPHAESLAAGLSLPAGSYVLTASAERLGTLRIPFAVAPGETAEVVVPVADLRAARLVFHPPPGELPPGALQVRLTEAATGQPALECVAEPDAHGALTLDLRLLPGNYRLQAEAGDGPRVDAELQVGGDSPELVELALGRP